VARREHNVIDADGVAHLLDVASRSRYAPLVTLAVYSGARRSELLALRRRDVDLEAGSITITRTLHRLKDGTFDIQPTKSAKSRRTLALPPAAVNTLRGHMERLEADLAALGHRLTLDRLLFANVDGSPLNPDLFSGAWRKIAAKAGFTGLRLHDARHSHASVLARAGVDARTISERLGHASVAFTFDTYVHAFADADQTAATVYGGLVDNAVSKRSGMELVDKTVDKTAKAKVEADQRQPLH
jgi:integrase